MKLRFLPLIALMAVMISCSKDDPAPSVENAKLSFSADEEAIVIPDEMVISDNTYASTVAGYVAEANALSSWTSLMAPPSGATKSTTEIEPVNGRIRRTSGAVVVYIFESQGYKIAYQVKDLSDSWSFELFQEIDGGWYRYFYATEKKDRSSGYMSLTDIWSGTNDELARWEWTRSGNLFNFTFTSEDWYKAVMQVDTSTKAGWLEIYWGETDANNNFYWDISSKITWNGNGSGTWAEYDGGNEVASGTFEP
jgi:hypothetical protein